MRERRFIESGRITEAVEGTEGLVWEAVFIEAGLSANGRRYRPEVLRRRASLFDGVRIFVDHPTASDEKERPERSSADIGGWTSEPEWSESVGKEGAITGKVHLLESNPMSARVQEAWERGKPDLYTLSIYGNGNQVMARENGQVFYDVEDITKIRSLDLVTEAAAGGRLSRLVASIRKEEEEDMVKTLTLEEILTLRPDLAEELRKVEEAKSLEAVASKLKGLVLALGQVAEKLSAKGKAAYEALKDAAAKGEDADLKSLVSALDSLSKDEAVAPATKKTILGIVAELGYSKPKGEDYGKQAGEHESDGGDGLEDKVKEEKENAYTGLQAEVASLKEAIAVSRCETQLGTRLAGLELPKAMKESLRSQFSGKVYTDEEFDTAAQAASVLLKGIEEERVAKERPTDHRPKIAVVHAEQDKFVDALTATILGESYEGVDGFRSLHQAFCRFQGIEFWDVSPQELAASIVRESINYDPVFRETLRGSISWAYVFGVSLNRVLVKDYAIPAYDEWQNIVSDFRNLKDMRAQRVERIGYYGTLPTVAAGGTYQEQVTSPSDVEGNYTPAKRGLLESWTWEDALNDDIGALRKIPKRLALAAKITLFKFVFDFLNDNAAVTYGDGLALFHASHGNLSTNAFSSANLTTAKIAMRSQAALSSTETFLGIKPKWAIVPNELEATALQVRDSRVEVTTAKTAQVSNPHQNSFDVIVVDYWTDDDKWILAADANLIPMIELGFLGGKRDPELFTEAPQTGSHFTADKVVVKIRHVYGGAIADHRGLYAGIPA